MSNNRWIRIFFVLVVIQALTIGRSLIWPELIGFNLPWPASPLNARFVAALYWFGVISAFLCVGARTYRAVQITLIEIAVLTGVLLLITLPHLGEFTPETFPYRWIILYTIDPLLVILILWQMRGHNTRSSEYSPLAPFLLGYATLMAILGIVLLVAPTYAASFWPWMLPPILAQVYSIFFLTFALGGVLAAREQSWDAIWIYVVASLIMLLLVIAVSLYHAERFKAGLPTIVWYLCCAMGLIGFGWALLCRPRALNTHGATL